MQTTSEVQQKDQGQAGSSFLFEYGALMMHHCRKIQQVLQNRSPSPDTGAVGDCDSKVAADTTEELRSALQVLALHCDYSGCFFDQFNAKLNATLSLRASDQARVAQHREARQLLKEVCLRSKAMSHDIIKTSRDLVQAFKAEQRTEDRRRRGSILSRAKELAKTPFRRSTSRSGSVAAANSSEPSAHDATSSRPHTPPPPLPPPPPQLSSQPPEPETSTPKLRHRALVDLERSPRARSPRRGRNDEASNQQQPGHQPYESQQRRKEQPKTAGQKVPAPPRRSSSLNSFPPDLQATKPVADWNWHQQQARQKPQPQPNGPTSAGGNGSLQSTENCQKTVPISERHQLVRPSTQPRQQHAQMFPPPPPLPVLSTQSQRCAVMPSPKASISSEGTAELPSETSIPSPTEAAKAANTKHGCGSSGSRPSVELGYPRMPQMPQSQPSTPPPPPPPPPTTQQPSKKRPALAHHSTTCAATDMDVRPSELDDEVTEVTRVTELDDEDTEITRVTEMDADETSAFNRDPPMHDYWPGTANAQFNPHAGMLCESKQQHRHQPHPAISSATPITNTTATKTATATTAAIFTAPATPPTAVVRQRKLLASADAGAASGPASRDPDSGRGQAALSAMPAAASTSRTRRRKRRQPQRLAQTRLFLQQQQQQRQQKQQATMASLFSDSGSSTSGGNSSCEEDKDEKAEELQQQQQQQQQQTLRRQQQRQQQKAMAGGKWTVGGGVKETHF